MSARPDNGGEVLAGGGGASLPATPAGALLDAGSPSTMLGLNASGVGEALLASAARSRIDAQQDVFTTRGDLVRAGVGGVAERLALGTATHVLTSDGTDAAWAAPTGGAPSGAAGGDLGGSYPNPTVADLTIASEARGDLLRRGASAWERVGVGTNGQVLTSDGTDPVWATPGGGTPTWLALYGASAFYMGGESATGWGSADYVTASAPSAVPAFGPGQSLVVCLMPLATPTTEELIATHAASAGRGWYLDVGLNSGSRRQLGLNLRGLNANATVALTSSEWTVSSAYVIAIVVKADKSIRYSVNGGAVQTIAALAGSYTAPTSADTYDLASTRTYSPTLYPLLSALLGEVRTYSTELSDADLVAACAGVATGTIPDVATGTVSTRFLPSDFAGSNRVAAQTGVTWVAKNGAAIAPR